MPKLTAVLFVFVFILSCPYIALGTEITVAKYEVTIQKIEFSLDAEGSNWVTAAEGDQITNPTMDICSAELNAKVAAIAQNLTLSVGTYVRCRLTISQTFVIRGTVDYGGSTYYTKTGTDQPSTITGPAQDSTINGASAYEQIVSGSLTITEGQSTVGKVVMNTSSCLTIQQVGPGVYMIVPSPPSWTFTQE